MTKKHPSPLRVAHRYLTAISEGSEKRDLEKLVKKFLDLLNPHLAKPVSIRDVSLKWYRKGEEKRGKDLVWELSFIVEGSYITVNTTALGRWRKVRDGNWGFREKFVLFSPRKYDTTFSVNYDDHIIKAKTPQEAVKAFLRLKK